MIDKEIKEKTKKFLNFEESRRMAQPLYNRLKKRWKELLT